MIKRITVIVIVILSIMLIVEQQDTYKPNYTKLSSDKLLFDDNMKIRATDGSNFSNDSLKNKYTYVFFGYTNCPDFCPDTLIKLTKLSNLVKNDNTDKKINVLFINVDTNDSLNKIKKYVEYFDSSFIGIKLEEDDLMKVTKNAGVYYKKISTEDGVDFFDHTGAIFLLDKNSKIMGIYTPPLIIDSLKDDILYGLK
tara:strand:- start:416 stop:1006 length:591 start_codon:yes stop_codon:yes gene_type:complete